MEEKEFSIKELFAFMNEYEGEFFIRVTIGEGGEFHGELDRCSVDSFDYGCTDFE